MPPSKEFVGLVSEYVHTVAHGEADGDEDAQKLARRAWGGLKRSAKAGTRRTVSACACVQQNDALLTPSQLHLIHEGMHPKTACT